MHNIMPLGYQAMVTSPHHTASAVGSAILQQGGNAFDAAVAVSAVLGVVYPHMTGLGGDSFFLLYPAHEHRVIGYNGSGRAGRNASQAHYEDRGLTTIPDRGMASVLTVPGMVDAWWNVWSRYGKLPWKQLLEPAIQYAEQGFPITRNLHYWMMKDETLLRADAGLLAICTNAEGRLLEEGERLIQPQLAETLRLIADGGRDVLYTGSIALSLAHSVQQAGGLLTEEDFAEHRGEWVQPISTRYRGADVYQMPPNSQGFSVLMMLNILEHKKLHEVSRHSAEFYHLAAEAVKAAFRYRDRYLSDPAFVQIPVGELISKPLGAALFKEPSFHAYQAGAFESMAMGQDTAYAAVVDQEGNAVSFIQSLYYDFGSGCTAGDTGIILQNRGSFFSLQPGHPNALMPGKRSFHTLMPGMVLRGGKPCLLAGTQGGEGQPQTTLSLLTGVLDYGCNIQEAIALPRWVYGRTWGEDSDTLKLENRALDPGAAGQLQSWGHQVELLPAWSSAVGQAQGIQISPDGVLGGAADPRGDGLAIGW
ncbi:gamma-glutamyltransferase [Paenibacillus sp. GCM10023252]|uniref:gamma-glutamyltransferase n=1 Tax=Paenibacillus sp. GCM10023252 TaxID=3252649 RepID=UPI00361E85DF